MVDFQVSLPGLARDFNNLTQQEQDFIAYFSAIDIDSLSPVVDCYAGIGPKGYNAFLILARIIKIKERILSDRQLAEVLKKNDLCRFVTRDIQPAHNTFNTLRKRLRPKGFVEIHKRFVLRAHAGYNVQAVADTTSKLIVSAHVTQQPNDKQEIKPTLERLATLPEELGIVTDLIADSGYFSEANVAACEKQELTPYITIDRKNHNEPLWNRFQEPPPLPDNADAVTRMKHRLKTTAGKAIYALGKTTSEPVFGVIKAVMGLRSFQMRGFEKAQGEWNLACIAWNLKRLHALTK